MDERFSQRKEFVEKVEALEKEYEISILGGYNYSYSDNKSDELFYHEDVIND